MRSLAVKLRAVRESNRLRSATRGSVPPQRGRPEPVVGGVEAFEEAFLNDRADIAFGSQVRTYTLQPYTMVKDERTDHKATNAESVLDGDLDEFIETYLLMNAEKKQAKKKTGEAQGD